MYSKIQTIGLFGLNSFPVEVETDISRGMPAFEIVGLTDKVISESRERIKASLRVLGLELPQKRIIISLAPASVKKIGSGFDLPIVVGLLSALDYIHRGTDGAVFIGEVSLNGDVRSVNGILPMVLEALKDGARDVYIPAENAYEASVAKGLRVYGVNNVKELAAHLNGEKKLAAQPEYALREIPNIKFDFADVKGQPLAKFALEAAAAGGHNALMIGAPGSGKSMLAKRMPSILPRMTFNESVETTNIYSIAGQLNKETPLITERPFRSPHHTISQAGLSGGGAIPQPGEISLAHNGLLFLDEMAEFDKRTLEILRQPLEEQQVTISRASGTVTYPCSIMLIGAMNPCPCGFRGHPVRKCVCGNGAAQKYFNKISGPLLDRFDLHIDVAPVEYEHISSAQKEEPSSAIRERVQKVREIQNERFKGTSISCNARITSDKLHEFCPVDKFAEDLLRDIFEKLALSARSYDRILKVARTMADMEDEPVIKRAHISQAAQFRTLDRKYTG